MTFEHLESRVLNRSTFFELVRDMDFPACTTPRHRLTDESTWDDYITSSARTDLRARLLGLLPTLMASGPGPRLRMAAWEQEGAQEPDRAVVDAQVLAHGDASLLPLVKQALCIVPGQVRSSALRQVVFILLNETPAFFTRATFRDGIERMVVLGPRTDVGLVLHELGHYWLSTTCAGHAGPPRTSVPAAGEQNLRQLAIAEGWEDRLDQHIAREERLADALAMGWWLC